jgi:hypothetical protein
VISSGALDALRRLAEEAMRAAERSPVPASDYERLRFRARELNCRFLLVPDDDFDNMLPSPDALLEIDALNRALGQGLEDARRMPVAPSVRSKALLLSIAGWALGIDAANQTMQ